ncbi:DUF4097 domain-containing protein [Streptomyces sp. N2-109]|uniref:DUF4097 domain-containing protein n=1 Tax=Streptomyces gossypii TaxID=2883101 RepID=A0ABT2JVC5_9ACTN|nr:DUF4097 domain-containing protein [Streptomyces gossypii]MCT2591815.1 DUF4097 domain-containing protein [Streptomyces gossypii]
MPAHRSGQITEPSTLDFSAPVEELQIRVVNGTVNVVGTDEPTARVEIAELHGPPLSVTHVGGSLVVAYEDLPWQGFLKWLDGKSWRREVVVSVSVPAHVRLTVGVVGASAVVSGIRGRTDVRGVSGGITLVGLRGEVHAETVTGHVETQSLQGPLRLHTVSGEFTVIDGSGADIEAGSVSGDMILDLAPADEAADISLTTVSGAVAVRLAHSADTRVRASTTGGRLSSAFGELRSEGPRGAKRLTGTLGAGSGRLTATSVSGAIALLCRPPAEEPAGFDDEPPADAAFLRKDI